MKRPGRTKNVALSPLLPVKTGESFCFEADDSSVVRIPATFLMKGPSPRDPQPLAARLTNHFILQNHGILNNFGISTAQDYNGYSVELVLKTGTRIGAIPLLSPTTGRPDYGLIIKPRFGWPGIGSMLGKMGWRVTPSILQLPLLPRSDRKIPPWVLSSTVLLRIKALLDRMERRFDYAESDLRAPRGSVNWNLYAMSRLNAGRFLDVPCRYPDLRDDEEIKAAIHHVLLKQLASLEEQRNAGVFVLKLISMCQSLLERVRSIAARAPSPVTIASWYRGTFRTEVFRDGLQALEWTVEDRGLAGLVELKGLPWIMSMEEFFEAWTETVVTELARRTGGILRTGRKKETVAPLVWDPPYVGSQKYLLPDLVLLRSSQDGGEEAVIFDAKYKSHWEELNVERWGNLADELKDRHRADLLQVLAYSTLFDARKVVSCLVYPCKIQTWNSLKRRGRLFHCASLNAGRRVVNLILAAMPMEAGTGEVVETLASALENAH